MAAAYQGDAEKLCQGGADVSKKRIRIVNAIGYPMATKILDAETGEDLTGLLMVKRIVIDIDINTRDISATLTCFGPEIDLVAEAEIEEAKIKEIE
jgi:hypothetical protein